MSGLINCNKSKAIGCKVGLAGRFKVAKKKGSEVTYNGDWFKNLITNNGLDLIGQSSSRFNYCAAGSGNSAPTVNDTAIESFLGDKQSPSVTYQTNLSEYYIAYIATYTFNIGAVVGNVSELTIGAGDNGTNIFSRALVKDGLGNPTSISVLLDEQLIVTWELRYYFNDADQSDTVDGYSIVMRPAQVDFDSVWHTLTGVAGMSTSTINSGYAPSAYTGGSLGAITGEPSGVRRIRTEVLNQSYASGTYQNTGTARWSPSSFAGTVSAFYVPFFPFGVWQFSVSPGIVKTSDDELEIDMTVTWGRLGEL